MNTKHPTSLHFATSNRNPIRQAYGPLERLAKLRQMFFQGDQSLGRCTLRLMRQSEDTRYAKFRENVR